MMSGFLQNGRPWRIERVSKTNPYSCSVYRLTFEKNDGSSLEWQTLFASSTMALGAVDLINKIAAPISEGLKLAMLRRERLAGK